MTRPRISLHCHRSDLYAFSRSSNLPLGYFDRRRVTSTLVLWVVVGVLAAGLLIAVCV